MRVTTERVREIINRAQCMLEEDGNCPVCDGFGVHVHGCVFSGLVAGMADLLDARAESRVAGEMISDLHGDLAAVEAERDAVRAEIEALTQERVRLTEEVERLKALADVAGTIHASTVQERELLRAAIASLKP